MMKILILRRPEGLEAEVIDDEQANLDQVFDLSFIGVGSPCSVKLGEHGAQGGEGYIVALSKAHEHLVIGEGIVGSGDSVKIDRMECALAYHPKSPGDLNPGPCFRTTSHSRRPLPAWWKEVFKNGWPMKTIPLAAQTARKPTVANRQLAA
jgi:hypothetical protein